MIVFYSKMFFIRKCFLFENGFYSKMIFIRKCFLVENVFCSKMFLFQNVFYSKMFLFENVFYSKMFFIRKCFYSKMFFIRKCFLFENVTKILRKQFGPYIVRNISVGNLFFDEDDLNIFCVYNSKRIKELL